MQNIQINSKFVKNGDVFIAIPCEQSEKHISEAFKNGAEIVFAESSQNESVIKISDARLLASKLAKFRYNKQPDVCVALTGTNGKSSVAHFLKQIWTYSGKKSANLGTLGLFINDDKSSPNDILIPNLTTPDAITLHKIMEYLKKEDVTNFVFEASSHALDQKRLHSANLSAAAFTNFSSDHLDYHKTRESYLYAKLRLFNEILPKEKPAIVSKDYPDIYNEISKINKNIISFGIENDNFIKANNINELPEKIIFDLNCGNEIFKNVEINLFGKFQIMNILCAISLALGSGLSIQEIVQTLPKISPLKGRMEHVKSINNGNVYIDYAHTSYGFKSALECFRKVCRGRLICVFGCGGDRDKSKRSEMGKIANDLSDITIVTDDNPRTESPHNIRKQIIETCPNAIEIGNRKEAISHGISLIEENDFLVVIGKGHEDYQIYADKTFHFSDKEEILKILTSC